MRSFWSIVPLALILCLSSCYPRGGKELQAAQVKTKDATPVEVLVRCLKISDEQGGCKESQRIELPRYLFGFVSGKRGKNWPDLVESYKLRFVCGDSTMPDGYHCAPWMSPTPPVEIEQPKLRDIEIKPERSIFFPEVEHIAYAPYPVPGSSAERALPDRPAMFSFPRMTWVGAGDRREYFAASDDSYPIRYATCNTGVDPIICSFRIGIPKSETAAFESNSVSYDFYSISVRTRFFPNNLNYVEQYLFTVASLLCEHLSCDLVDFRRGFVA